MISKLFRRKEYLVSNRQGEESQYSKDEKPNVPEGIFEKCKKCGKVIYSKELLDNHKICKECGAYFKVSASERFAMIFDDSDFLEYDKYLRTKDPLNFPAYEQKLIKAQSKTGLIDGIITGKGKIDGQEILMAVMDAGFFMGSMGSVVGEKIARLFEKACDLNLPLIIFTASGGARMQEGIYSLMQMAKVSGAVARHSDLGLLYVTVLTDPTTGGVTASFAMLGDIILAEPGALIGFAGPRVIEQTIGEKLPTGFQRAEFLLKHGFIDKIIPREEMRDTLGRILRLHST